MAESEDEVLGWAVVANVREPAPAEQGKQGRGSRHFSPGTKVWVLPAQWGDGAEDLFIVGRHRGRPGGHVRMVTARSNLTNFRVQAVYSASVWRVMNKTWTPQGDRVTRQWSDRDEALLAAQRWTAQADPS